MKIYEEWSMEEKLVELASQAHAKHLIMIEQVRLPAEKWDDLEESLGSRCQYVDFNKEIGIRLHTNHNYVRVMKRENKE